MSGRLSNSPILFELFESDDEKSSIEIPLNRIESETSNGCVHYSQSDVSSTCNKSIIIELEKSQSWVSSTPPAGVINENVTQSVSKEQCYPALELRSLESAIPLERSNPSVCNFEPDFATQPAFILGLESQLSLLEEATPSQHQAHLLHLKPSPTLTQTISAVKRLKRCSKQQTQPGKMKRKPVSFRCKLNGGWCLIDQKNAEALDVIEISLNEIKDKVDASANPNIRKLKLFLKEIEAILKLLGDDRLEQTLPQELWSDMILNSWNTFHETEKLLESSPSCPASKSPRGLNSLSESELNETQEYPLLKNSAAESQDFTRQPSPRISNTFARQVRSDNRAGKKKSISNERFSSQQSAKKTTSHFYRAFNLTNETAKEASGIEEESAIPSQLKEPVHAPEVGRITCLNTTDIVARPEVHITQTDEIDKIDHHSEPLDCSSLLVELTQGPDFRNTSAGDAIPSQITSGTYEEPQVIYETQICHPSDNIITKQAKSTANDLLWKKSRLALSKFSLKPFIDGKVLSAGKDLKLKLNDHSYSGTLLEDGKIQSDGSVFQCIGKWIQSISNGQHFLKLPKRIRETFDIEYDGKCLYDLVGTRVVGMMPKETSNSNKIIVGARVNSTCEPQPIVEEENGSASRDNLPGRMLTKQTPICSKTLDPIRVNSTCKIQQAIGDDGCCQSLNKLVRNEPLALNESANNRPSNWLANETKNCNEKSETARVNPTCHHQPAVESGANNEKRALTFQENWRNSQASEEVNYSLVPLNEMRKIIKVIHHPPTEWFRTCQCVEDFWENGRLPKCVLDDLNWD